MIKISATQAKQHFAQLVAQAAGQVVAIERHGKVVAAVVPASWLDRLASLDERRAAREAERRLQLQRLLAHQRVGIRLLSSAAERRRLLGAARAEVSRWQEQRLCSADYIERWSAWLALPVAELVEAMCSDAQGWGPAMRQNSPFGALA